MSSFRHYLRPAVGSLLVLCVLTILAVFSSSGVVEKVSKVRPVTAHLTSSGGQGGIGWQTILGKEDNNLGHYETQESYDESGIIVQRRGKPYINNFPDKLIPQSRILFNRVGKCGSRTVLTIIKELSNKNGFKFVGSEINNLTHMPLQDQIDLVNIISALDPPFLFQRHFHFIDFAKFGGIEPVYINIIRDPINRFTSQYYFKRYGDETHPNGFFKGSEDLLNMTINECVLSNHHECRDNKLYYITPFFCGQHEQCRTPSRWSLNKAISNFDEKFLFVGFIEELEDSFNILEKLLPGTFQGAVEILNKPAATASRTITSATKNKIPPTEEVRSILLQRMEYEYEFYNYAKKKFAILKRQLKI
ncbi:uronyl 2-sulfotransferase-like isoform X2 [Glandiceps talaboti]